MNTITINFTVPTVVSSYDLGNIGEHNATELVITPPTSLSGDSRTAFYRVQFRTGSETITSESYTEVPFTVTLWQQLTEHSRLSLQIVAYDADGEYIGKSDKLSGFYFDASIGGMPADADTELHGLEADINANTAARHTHSNKAVLDDITYAVPKTVNGKSADNNKEITLKAEDISADSGWTPTNDTDLVPKKYVDDHSGGIIEKTIELDLDWELAAVTESMYGSNGEEIFLFGDQTQQGGLLYNARVTGLDVKIAGSWYNAYQILNARNFPIIPQIPFVVNIDGDDFTFIGFTWEREGSISTADKVRIHYIEIAGVQPVTPPSQE